MFRQDWCRIRVSSMFLDICWQILNIQWWVFLADTEKIISNIFCRFDRFWSVKIGNWNPVFSNYSSLVFWGWECTPFSHPWLPQLFRSCTLQFLPIEALLTISIMLLWGFISKCIDHITLIADVPFAHIKTYFLYLCFSCHSFMSKIYCGFFRLVLFGHELGGFCFAGYTDRIRCVFHKLWCIRISQR